MSAEVCCIYCRQRAVVFGDTAACMNCPTGLMAFAARTMADTMKHIQKTDTPEFRRQYLEGRMSDVKGWDWYYDPTPETAQAIERQHEADWLRELPTPSDRTH